MQNMSFMKLHLIMSSAKWWTFCLGEMTNTTTKAAEVCKTTSDRNINYYCHTCVCLLPSKSNSLNLSQQIMMLFKWILYFMMTSSNGSISPATDEFHSQRPVTQIFDVFIDLCLNKSLSKQLGRR